MPTADLDTLIALTRDYVASVRNCAVDRLDEILAEDFLCSNPNGSLVDRAAFLKQTARLRALHRRLGAPQRHLACGFRACDAMRER